MGALATTELPTQFSESSSTALAPALRAVLRLEERAIALLPKASSGLLEPAIEVTGI